MKFPHYYILFLIVALLPEAVLWAQEPVRRYQTFDNLIETLTEDMEEESDMSVWLEELQVLYENPINLNSASLEELMRIPFLNEISAASILEYRKKTGKFLSVFELASIENIGRDLAEKISFFVTTDADPVMPSDRKAYKPGAQHQLLVKGWQTIPKSAGYLPKNDKPPAYQGGPQKLYARYLLQKGAGFQAGITGDRDPGEEFFKGSNPYGFDFYSAHVSFRVNDLMPQIIVGDFVARTGQGLVIWQGFTLGKSAEVLQVSKSLSQIRPYTSTDENFFFRGVATTLQKGNLRSHLFVSHKKSDGNLVFADDGSITFSSLQTSGYHRTLSEIDDKNSVGHTVAGSIINYTIDKVKFGVNLLYERFQYPFVRGNQLYQKFLFSGQENYNGSVDYRWVSGKYQFYGEAAMSRSGGVSLLQGLDARLHDQFNLAMIFRHFGKNYHSTWANAFGENSRAINETGFYAGFRAYPAPKIILSGYADWFYSPWINYATIGPTRGYEFLLQVDYRHSRKLSAYSRIRYKSKADKNKADNLYYDEFANRTNFRTHFRYQISDQFFLRTRVEYVWFEYLNRENGLLVFQDAGWSPSKPNLSAVARLAWFRTDSYNSRVYAYENDLLYNFSTLSFYGEGIRAYLNVRYNILNGLDGWFKIAQTIYSDRDVISSGNSLIDGNRKTEVKIQFRYRF